MSPILSLEAEISAAVKTAAAQRRCFDLLADIQVGVKLAADAAPAPVTPPAPAAPAPAPASGGFMSDVGNAFKSAVGLTPRPGAAPAPASSGFTAAMGTTPRPPPAASTPVTPAAPSAAQQAGKPTTTPTPAAPAAGKPTTPEAPKPTGTHRPSAPQSALSSGWDTLKNNWDVAAIPLSLLAMMFGGKTGKMLGMLGLAAGSYGLHNRYKTLTNFGEGVERKEGESDANFALRQQAMQARNVQGNFRAAEAKKNADSKFLPQIEAAKTQLDAATQQLAPEQAAQVPAVLQARTAMLDAQDTVREIQQKTPQDVEAIKAAREQATQAAQAFGKMNVGGQFNGVVSAHQGLNEVQYRHQKAMAPWTAWQQKNAQLSDSIKGIMAMGGGGMVKQRLASIKGLEGASDRTVQDLMYRLGHADKPAVYTADAPITAAEREADRHLNWMLTTEDAPEKIQAGGAGGFTRAADAVVGVGQHLIGGHAPSWYPGN